MTTHRENHEFHLNGIKRYLVGVAVAVTTAILCQSMALIWWAGTITTRVEYMEKHVAELNVRVHGLETGKP